LLNSNRDYEIQHAVDILRQAEKIKNDPKLLKDIKAETDKVQKIVSIYKKDKPNMKKDKYENSPLDEKLDKKEAKKGIKEGSKKDLAVDKVAKKQGEKPAMKKLKEITKPKKKK
jgi:hypothetical protein